MCQSIVREICLVQLNEQSFIIHSLVHEYETRLGYMYKKIFDRIVRSGF
jgi:hypothetical protein